MLMKLTKVINNVVLDLPWVPSNIDIFDEGCREAKKVEKHCSRTGVGNYYRPQATLLLYKCLAGHTLVKKALSKLKKLAFAGRMWPAGRMLPPPALELCVFVIGF